MKKVKSIQSQHMRQKPGRADKRGYIYCKQLTAEYLDMYENRGIPAGVRPVKGLALEGIKRVQLYTLCQQYPTKIITTHQTHGTFSFTQRFCGECIHYSADGFCQNFQFTNTSPRREVELSLGCASCVNFVSTTEQNTFRENITPKRGRPKTLFCVDLPVVD
jgi:hypothetical protein